ncbi:hypothetical protein HY989_06495 [Candidatus Micrarchaeota archaeon]|nr:hypothetical protein [Candidatus Micrarchaeota archaeon]
MAQNPEVKKALKNIVVVKPIHDLPIHLVGMTHGDLMAPMPRSTDKFLKNYLGEINARNGAILTEGPSTQNMVPKEFRNIALPIESEIHKHNPAIKEIKISKIYSHLAKQIILSPYFSTKRYFRRTEPVFFPFSKKTEAILKKEAQKDLKSKLGFSKTSIGYIINFRSAYMAAQLLHAQRINNKEAVLVSGLLHNNQIERFLRKPDIVLRYLRKVGEQVEIPKHFVEFIENEFKILKERKAT